MTSKAQEKKSKNRQQRLHQVKNLLSRGNNQQNQESTYRMEENICQLFIQKRINI
jgi:hypothetical protein